MIDFTNKYRQLTPPPSPNCTFEITSTVPQQFYIKHNQNLHRLMFTPLTVEDYNFKHIKPTHRDFSASAGRTRTGSLANISPKCVPFHSSPAKNDTYGSQQLMQSNEFLRCKLRTAEASVCFLNERIKVMERNERQCEENVKLQELAYKETQEQLKITTGKYKALKKMVGEFDKAKRLVEEQAETIKRLEAEKAQLDAICEKYNQELKRLKENSDTERLLGENHELNGLVEQMRPELRRLTELLESTNIKLERFEQEKKQLTKELFLARMEKQSMYRLFDKCDGKSESQRSMTLVEAYNELVMRWAQLLQENEELQLQKVHLNEQLTKLGWKESSGTPQQPKKDKKFLIPPLNFSNSKNKNPKEVLFFETVSSCSIGCSDRDQVRIIDSEQSCEIVTPGTVKRAGAIRSMAGKLVSRQ